MTGATIHPTAIVDPKAELGEGVVVGPYSIIGPDAKIGAGSVLQSHVVIDGDTTIGARATVYPFAVLGKPPQDFKYKGEKTRLEVGDDCLIREGVTMHLGTPAGKSVTKVGDRCAFFAYSHIAHDCVVGNNVIFANNVLLAGFVSIGDFAILGGGAGIHQFTRIGAHAFIGGLSAVAHDVIPYGMAIGNRASLTGLNLVGLRRRGFDREQIHILRRAYRLIFANEGTLLERVEDVAAAHIDNLLVTEVLDFIREGRDRSLLTPDANRASD